MSNRDVNNASAMLLCLFILAMLSGLAGCGSTLEPSSIDRDTFCAPSAEEGIAAKVVNGTFVAPSGDTDPSTVRVGRCTGTKIAPSVFLTAAHCNITTEHSVSSAFGGSVGIADTVIHPDYDHYFSGADLRLVFTVSDLHHVPITAIGVPTKGAALVQGYGVTDSGVTGHLAEAEITIAGFSGSDHIHSGLGTERGPDACFGDSGGPLYQNGKLVGVVSFGLLGADTGDRVYDTCGWAGVYVAPSAHLDWIEAETGVTGESC